MRLRLTKPYIAYYEKLPRDVQRRVDKQLYLLLENPQHPSLRLHKMKDRTGRWEIAVTMKYRIIFHIEGDEYVLCAVGPHDILKRP